MVKVLSGMVKVFVLTLELFTFETFKVETKIVSFNLTELLFTDILVVPVRFTCVSAFCNPLILDMVKALSGMVKVFVLTLELFTFETFKVETKIVSFNLTELLFTDILVVPVRIACLVLSAVCNPFILGMVKALSGMVNVVT